MTETQFTCSMCGARHDLIRDETWSEEKAIAEMKDNFPGFAKEDCTVVCDDCYQRMTQEYPPSEFMKGEWK